MKSLHMELKQVALFPTVAGHLDWMTVDQLYAKHYSPTRATSVTVSLTEQIEDAI